MAHDVSLACRALIAVVFALSAGSKIYSRAAWRSYRTWLAGLPLRPLRRAVAPAALTGAEIAVVLLSAIPVFAAWPGLAAGAALCLALTAGLAIAVRRGSWQPCHCFGSSSEPLGRQHVIRNLVLFACTLAGLIAAVTGRSSSVPGTAESWLAVIGGLAAAVLIVFSGDIGALLTSQPAPAQPEAAHRRHAVTG